MRRQHKSPAKKIKAIATISAYFLLLLASAFLYGVFWRMEMPSNEEVAGHLTRNGYQDVTVGDLLFLSACHHKDLYAFEFTGYLSGRFIEGTLCWKRSDIEIIHKPTTIFNQ